MITSLFRKSTPLNYTVIVVLVLTFFLLFQFMGTSSEVTILKLIEKVTIAVLIFASFFVINFIVKKNGISKDNSYTILFFFLLLLFFPALMDDINLVLANFFILLSFRKIMSLHSLKSHKEKIFDASLWIFIAAFFHFWSILFIALVFIAILFHVSRDYRNWLLPFIALFATVMAFTFFALLIDESRITRVFDSMQTNFNLDYFTQTSQNVSFAIYVTFALFFLISFVASLSSRPLMLQSSYKKIIMAFVTGVAVFLISPQKGNELLLFTMAPLAMMATSHIEVTKSKFHNEFVLSIVIIAALYNFFAQL